IAGGEGLQLAGAEVVNDQAVEHGAQVIAKSPLAPVRAGQLAGQELGPELLEDLVSQVFVADLQVDISGDGIVIPVDELLHRGVALGGGGMGATDGGPTRLDFGEPLFIHRYDPNWAGLCVPAGAGRRVGRSGVPRGTGPETHSAGRGPVLLCSGRSPGLSS